MMSQFKFTFFALIILIATFATVAEAKGNNIHLIQEDTSSGFAIYRTSKPSMNDMKEFCRLGIEEMVVLSGNAEKFEYKYQAGCPGLKVVYNEEQSGRKAVKASFLEFFDDWVAEAKRTGKKIAFRCNCGCHRTGRLAAYYQMKYQGVSLADAQILMKKHGKWMFLFKTLWKQTAAMKDHIDGKMCSQRRKYCVDTGEYTSL